MADFRLRPRSLFSTKPFSSYLSSISHHITSRFLLIITALLLSLAALTFFLHFWTGFNDPAAAAAGDLLRSKLSSPGVKCNQNDDVLGRSSYLSFPYFRDWWFNYNDSSDHQHYHHDSAEPQQSKVRFKSADRSTFFGNRLRVDLSWLMFTVDGSVSFLRICLMNICITTSTSAGLEQVLPWIMYHKHIGISNFFLFVEGKAASPNVGGVLETIPGVKVLYRTPKLEEHQLKSRIWNETWLAEFFYKPCNYELFVKQNLNMEMGIDMAREAGMEWIFHLDTDELVYPAGTPDYSVKTLLDNVPELAHEVIFSNYETAVERDDIKEPFGEISLFKKSYDHLTQEIYNKTYVEATRGNRNYFLTYGNGKAAARIRDHLRPNGAHRWYNYENKQNEMAFTEAAVLHYTYSKFSDLTSRRDRCQCKPTVKDLERCFMMEFDRDAFIVASTSTEEEMRQWYNDHVVWGNMTLKTKLLKDSVLTRIYTPMLIIQTLKESGVFSSIIETAAAQKKNKTAASKDHQVTTVSFSAAARNMSERKVSSQGRSGNVRSAIPPLSPPTLDELTAIHNNKKRGKQY